MRLRVTRPKVEVQTSCTIGTELRNKTIAVLVRNRDCFRVKQWGYQAGFCGYIRAAARINIGSSWSAVMKVSKMKAAKGVTGYWVWDLGLRT